MDVETAFPTGELEEEDQNWFAELLGFFPNFHFGPRNVYILVLKVSDKTGIMNLTTETLALKLESQQLENQRSESKSHIETKSRYERYGYHR
ncbi:hypothetical protein RND71_036109 [Anisodus tanguticus]|uniref:Uncharacterized protein n=1 Tax=Anisodus tanguticus TaxID=243964 RepID=A0AAE1R6X3_9SOLA|nr:hypothetical protein RND71_036109 [Anisodus tanguticus]